MLQLILGEPQLLTMCINVSLHVDNNLVNLLQSNRHVHQAIYGETSLQHQHYNRKYIITFTIALLRDSGILMSFLKFQKAAASTSLSCLPAGVI